MPKKTLYSTTEAAAILRLSRVEVFRKIKAGKIRAEKIGRNYVIPYDSITEALGKTLGSLKRAEIDKTIDKALRDFGETFKKLGKE